MLYLDSPNNSYRTSRQLYIFCLSKWQPTESHPVPTDVIWLCLRSLPVGRQRTMPYAKGRHWDLTFQNSGQSERGFDLAPMLPESGKHADCHRYSAVRFTVIARLIQSDSCRAATTPSNLASITSKEPRMCPIARELRMPP